MDSQLLKKFLGVTKAIYYSAYFWFEGISVQAGGINPELQCSSPKTSLIPQVRLVIKDGYGEDN